eukprot:SAG22_NODE_1400_length_4502_cov_10.780831_5_plen_308_part_00
MAARRSSAPWAPAGSVRLAPPWAMLDGEATRRIRMTKEFTKLRDDLQLQPEPEPAAGPAAAAHAPNATTVASAVASAAAPAAAGAAGQPAGRSGSTSNNSGRGGSFGSRVEQLLEGIGQVDGTLSATVALAGAIIGPAKLAAGEEPLVLRGPASEPATERAPGAEGEGEEGVGAGQPSSSSLRTISGRRISSSVFVEADRQANVERARDAEERRARTAELEQTAAALETARLQRLTAAGCSAAAAGTVAGSVDPEPSESKAATEQRAAELARLPTAARIGRLAEELRAVGAVMAETTALASKLCAAS